MLRQTTQNPVNQLLLRSLPPTNDKADQSEEQFHDTSREKESLLCTVCNNKITSEQQGFARGGKTEHTFINPHGMLFRVGCFYQATGCGVVGSPSSEFSWFAGFAWQIAFCRECQTHLGWLFSNDQGHQFYGLIITRLKPG